MSDEIAVHFLAVFVCVCVRYALMTRNFRDMISSICLSQPKKKRLEEVNTII